MNAKVLFVQRLDRLQIGEGVLTHLARDVRLMAQQTPLLEKPQVVLGDPRIQTTNLPMAQRTSRRKADLSTMTSIPRLASIEGGRL